MTSCDKCREMLRGYLDGELSQEDTAFFENHVQQCTECAQELTKMREMLNELHELGDTPVPDAVHEAWTKAVRAEAGDKHKKRSKRQWMRGLSYAAAAIALLFVGSLLGSPAEETLLANESGSNGYYASDQEAYNSAPEPPVDIPKTGQDLYGEILGSALMDEAAEEEQSFADDADGGSGGGYGAEGGSGEYGAQSRAFESEATADKADTESTAQKQEAKIIREAYLYFTCLEFTDAVDTLKSSTENFGGYLEYSTESGFPENYNRYGEYHLRIPSDKLNDFLASIEGIGKKRQENIGSRDVSESYYDTKTRLETLRAQYARLQELMAQAEKVSALIEIEEKMTEVLYEIESLEASLRNIDNRVAYSQVYVELTEEAPIKEPVVATESFGDRITRAFYQGINTLKVNAQRALLYLIRIAPTLVVLIPLIIIAILIIRRIYKKHKKAGKNHDEEL